MFINGRSKSRSLHKGLLRTFKVMLPFFLPAARRAAVPVGGRYPDSHGFGPPFAGPPVLRGGDAGRSRRPSLWQEPGREHLASSSSSRAGKGTENQPWALGCFCLGPCSTAAISGGEAAVLGNVASQLASVHVWGRNTRL